jgi:type IV secretory pathway VirB6-like protein
MINSHFILPEDVIKEVLSFVVIIFQQTAADVHNIAYDLISVTWALILYTPGGTEGSHTLPNKVTLG